MKLCVLFLSASLIGCSSLMPGTPRTTRPGTNPSRAEISEQCQAIDDASMTWGAVAVVGGGLAASSGGLSALPGETQAERASLAVGAVAAGAVAAGAAYLEHAKARQFIAAGCAE